MDSIEVGLFIKNRLIDNFNLLRSSYNRLNHSYGPGFPTKNNAIDYQHLVID